MFVNIIIIVLQLAYETETLNKNNVKKYIYQKTQKLLKTIKKPKDVVLTVSEKHKNIGTKTHQIFLVCATQPTHFSRRDYSIKALKNEKYI